MMSCPGHPLWKVVVDMAFERWKAGTAKDDIMWQSGPFLLNDAIDSVLNGTIHISDMPVLADAETFYPKIDSSNWQLKAKCAAEILQQYHNRMQKAGTLWKWENRVESCRRLRELSFVSVPANSQSWAIHHWTHGKTWAPAECVPGRWCR